MIKTYNYILLILKKKNFLFININLIKLISLIKNLFNTSILFLWIYNIINLIKVELIKYIIFKVILVLN